MNIDSLISKYLDGELTESEDLQLRNIISSNEKARDIFNTYIDLHIAAKEDAKSITTPEDLVSSTEDIVMMAIMNASATPVSASRSFNIFNIFPRQLVSMVAALLLITFTYTSDLNFFKFSNPSYSKAEMLIELPEATVENSFKRPVINQKQDINSYADNTSDNKNKNVNLPLENKMDLSETNFESVSKLEQNSIISSNSLDNRNEEKVFESYKELPKRKLEPTITILDENSTTSNMQFGDIGNRIRQPQNNIAINNIQLTAFTSSPYTLYGFDDKANASISSYSQAVAVNLNEKTSVGLEIGYSDIAYRAETFTYTNVLDKYGRETGQQIVFRTERDKDYAMYWGQVFVQSNLYEISDFDLGLRLGLGISESGLTSNSRLLASYELINGVKLTAGTEFNYFTVSLPQLVNSYTQNYYSFSMVYGLQFSF
ncbi:MAG: hypothetical protein R2863_03785 [Candidatus Kapaibacterium sp.]|nr:hypothetical protein [Ignavibacteriota bacterium]MCB9222053.1 hypothetical protein [Ignavibacteria bacterium]